MIPNLPYCDVTAPIFFFCSRVDELTTEDADEGFSPFYPSFYLSSVPFCLYSYSSSCVFPFSFSFVPYPVPLPRIRFQSPKRIATAFVSAFSCPEIPSVTARVIWSKTFVCVSCLETWTWTFVGGGMGTASTVDSCRVCRNGRFYRETYP